MAVKKLKESGPWGPGPRPDSHLYTTVKGDPSSRFIVSKYQKLVDYDMKHYGKISQKTQDLIKKAGLKIVKDDHGDYEVKEESCGSKKLSEGDVSFFKKKRSRNTYKVYVYNKNDLPYKDLYRIVKNYELSLELPGYWQPGYSDNPSDIILIFTPNEIDNLSKAFSEINDNYSPEDIKDIAKNQGIFSESLKEGYSDGTVSTSEIMDAINSLEELVEMMDDAGVDSIHASSSTYGLGQHFIGFPGGFINYNDVYSYVSEDEEDEYYEESLKNNYPSNMNIIARIKGAKGPGTSFYIENGKIYTWTPYDGPVYVGKDSGDRSKKIINWIKKWNSRYANNEVDFIE